MKRLGNRGFTLIELVAIVVILAAIFLVAFPTITNMAKKAKNEKYNLMVNVLCDAGKSYIYSNKDEYDVAESGTKTIIPLSDLIEYGVVDSTTTNPKDNTLVSGDALIFTTNDDSSLSCTYRKLEVIPVPTTDNCNSELVYNGNEQNLVKNPNINLAYTNDKGITAGSYTVTATILDRSSYRWEDNSNTSKTFTCSIGKSTLTPNVTCDSTKIYDGTKNTNCNINLAGIKGSDEVTATGTCSYDTKDVGTNKTITCTSLALSGAAASNYQFGSSSATTTGNIYNATLAFNADGGTVSGSNPMYVRKGQTGLFTGLTDSTFGASPVGVKTGHTFDGWYTGNTKVIDPVVTFNGTKVAAGANDTHKGIVYLDPTDLSRTCTAALANANVNSNNTPTGITSGCMKFYIYNDEGSEYKLILDHNTSGNVAWNSDGTTTTMNEVATRLYADTLGWIGNPRLITANEIAQITGIATAVGFDETDSTSQWFYFDGSGSTYAAWHTQVATSQGASNYTWLFDYTYQCKQYGCNVEDNNGYPYPTMNSSNTNQAYGYWTSSIIASDTTKAWNGFRGGYLGGSVLNNQGFGVRPVITIPKSVIDKTNPIQASVTNWTDSSSKWLLTANAELTARYSVNKYKATFYSNMIMNGDFANTTGQGWASVSYATGTVDTSVKNGTMNSMRIKPTGSSWDGIATIYRPNFKNNTTYKITLKAYRDSSSSYGDVTRDFRVYAPELNSNGNVIDYHHGITINTSNLPDKTWKEFTYTFTTTASGVAFQYLRLDFNATSGDSNIWVSDVKLEEVVTRTYDYNSELGTIPTTTRTGYTSLGYYTGQNGTGTLISANTRIGAANTSYYENWSMQSYTISYNLNGGSVSSANPTSYSSESEYITLNNPTKLGYTFTGWTGSNGSTPQTTVTIPTGSTGDRNYTANWTIKTHTVTCEDYFVDASKNRKVKLGSGTKTYNYGATASGADWGTTTSMSTYYSYYVYKEATSGTVPDNDNLVVYRYFWAWTDLNIFNAAGSQNGATVSFKVGNGSWADVTNESNTTQPWGTTYYLKNIRPVNSTTEELSSVSNLTWDSTNQYYYYTPTSAGTNMNVYLKYKTFAITLDRQDGFGGTATIYEKYNTGYYTNNTATTQMTTGANAISVPSRTGYTFGGYYTGTNGSGTQYINASGYLTSSASATAFTAAGSLYAKWTIVPYTISYNYNGGSVSTDNANPTSYNVNSGAISLNNPSRSGYNFVGWSGTSLSGSSNVSVTIPAGSTGNRSYTANWSPIGYSISYDLKGGSASNITSYNVETNSFTLTNPTKSGYTFTGWTGSNGTTPQTTVTISKGSTGDRSYTAHWDRYELTYDLNRGTVQLSQPNDYVNTGFYVNYANDFRLNALVNAPSPTGGKTRHQIFGNYNDMSVRQDFGLEFNEYNKLRVWMNYDGNSATGHAATIYDNTVSLNTDISVQFVWTASSKSYTLTTSGSSSNHTINGTNANMTGSSPYTLLIGTKDQRSGNGVYGTITVKSASITTKPTAGSTLSLPSPSNGTSQNYVFHGWFTETGGKGTQATNSTTIDRDTTYYGHWTNEVLWMSAPSTNKNLVTGTGNTRDTGYETGTTFTFTCNGGSGHYPTSLQIKNNGTVVATATNSSSTTYILTKAYVLDTPSSSTSITGTCTDNTGKTVDSAAPTRPTFRRFRLYYDSNGATLSGGDTTTTSTQYLIGNNTTQDGGHPVKLYSVSREARGLGSTAYGFSTGSSVKTTSPPWGKNGASVNIYYGSGTQSANVVYASDNYAAVRTLYAISRWMIYNPTKSANAQDGMVLLTADSTYLYLWNTLMGVTSTYRNTCPADKPLLKILPYGAPGSAYITICNGSGASCGINYGSNDYFTRQLSGGGAYYSYGNCFAQ